MINDRPKALIALENGLVLRGRGFGRLDAEAVGEIVFNTSMTGYQEILSDPSYFGQIITFTYPHQGNVGTNRFDSESDRAQAAGAVVRELSRIRSNWRSEQDLAGWLDEAGILGVEGVDTRQIVRTIRIEGAQRCVMSTIESDPDRLVERARALPTMAGANLVGEVTTSEPYEFEPIDESGFRLPGVEPPEKPYRVAVLDFGVKRNILERLAANGCHLIVLPASTPADEIMKHEPDGLFISNGPGDPDAVERGVETVRALVGRLPIFGICLGHQLLALALGGRTYKLKFGHRGANHPVRKISSGANEITSQNHGFAVDLDSMADLPVDLTHVNLNDRTVEGFRHREHPLFCVQYHPEAGPGPHDADYLFADFITMMREQAEKVGSAASAA